MHLIFAKRKTIEGHVLGDPGIFLDFLTFFLEVFDVDVSNLLVEFGVVEV